jgi:hypothetical protein
VALRDDLERIARAAAAHAVDGERVSGVLAAEPAPGRVVYVCAFERGEGEHAWLALDDDGEVVRERTLVRDAVSLAALCEIAGDSAGGGHLDELRSQLAALRITESPEGIEEAERAAAHLERVVGVPPRVASTAWLDDVGIAARELERALGDDSRSPFGEAMKGAIGAVDALTAEVESAYKTELR